MRCALLGDARTLCALAAPLANSGCQLVAAGANALSQEPALLSREILFVPDWPALLSLPAFDLVVVSWESEPVAHAARQLAASGAAVLVDLQSADPIDQFHQFTVLDLENEADWIPAFCRRGSGLVNRLRSWLRGAALGQISHVRIEVCLAPAAAGGDQLVLAEPGMSIQLLNDVDLARSLFGELDSVTCVYAGTALRSASIVTATFAGAHAPQIAWSASCAAQARWQMTIHAGNAVVRLSEDFSSGELCLECERPGTLAVVERGPANGAAWLIEALAQTRSGGTGASLARNSGETLPSLPTWNDLAVGVELLEAVAESARRRRTVEVYRAAHSERCQFKTQMTALGCGVLLVTLAAAVAYLMLATLVPMPEWLQRILAALIFAPLGLFLVLQALLFVARPRAGPKR